MAAGEQARHRGEAQERSRLARRRSEAQHAGAVPGRGRRQETCKHQTGVDLDLEYGRFGEYIKQLEERWAKLEDRLTAHVEAEIESQAAQLRDDMVERQRVLDDDRASMVEQLTARSKKLQQGFETHAENLKDLLAQSCRAGMARLTVLEVKPEELEAELTSQQDREDMVNKLEALISDRLQHATDGCDSFRARFEHLESRLNTVMEDTGCTHVYDELQKLKVDTKSQSDGMRELEKKLEEQADELRAYLKSHEQVPIGLVLNHLPEKEEAPTVTAETEGDEEEVALTSDEAYAGDFRQLQAGRNSRATPDGPRT